MKKFLQISGLVALTIIVLSVTFNGKPIFHYVYRLISPTTLAAQKATEEFFGNSLNKTNRYSKRLFSNSVPKVRDSLDSKMSATIRIAPQEHVTAKDRAQLDDLIKTHH